MKAGGSVQGYLAIRQFSIYDYYLYLEAYNGGEKD